MKRLFNVALAGVFVVIAASAFLVGAQTSGATVKGTITDTTSAVLPGVKVTATNSDTKAVLATISDSEGKYALSGLPEGDYVFSAVLPGFTTSEIQKPIQKNAQVEQNFAMSIGQGKIRTIIGPPSSPSRGMVIPPNGNFR